MSLFAPSPREKNRKKHNDKHFNNKQISDGVLYEEDERGSNYFLSFLKPRGIYVKERRIEKLYGFIRTGITLSSLVWSANNYGFFSIVTIIIFVVLLALILPNEHVKHNNNDNNNSNRITINDTDNGYIYNPADSYDDNGDGDKVSNHLLLPKSKHILPWHSVIHQIGRQTLLNEFKVLCSGTSWQNEVRNGLVEIFKTGKTKINGEYHEPLLTRSDMDCIGKRCKGIIRRIIRQSPCSERLRQQYLNEMETSKYFTWLLDNGGLGSYIELLPYSLENPDDVFAGVNILKPEPYLHKPITFRIWTLKIFACHVIKRYLKILKKYPIYDSLCVICKEKKVSMSFIGCNHTILCGQCGREVYYSEEKWGNQKCPLCRRGILGLTDESLERVR